MKTGILLTTFHTIPHIFGLVGQTLVQGDVPVHPPVLTMQRFDLCLLCPSGTTDHYRNWPCTMWLLWPITLHCSLWSLSFYSNPHSRRIKKETDHCHYSSTLSLRWHYTALVSEGIRDTVCHCSIQCLWSMAKPEQCHHSDTALLWWQFFFFWAHLHLRCSLKSD